MKTSKISIVFEILKNIGKIDHKKLEVFFGFGNMLLYTFLFILMKEREKM